MLKIKEALLAPWKSEIIFSSLGMLLLSGFLFFTADTTLKFLDILLVFLALIVFLMYMGYLVNAAGSASREEQLPFEEDFYKLISYGLGIALVLLVFSIPLFIITGFVKLITGLKLYELLTLFPLTFSGIFLIIVTIITLYFAGSAVVQMAQKKHFSAAFTLESFHRSFTSDYFFAFIIGLILSIIGILLSWATLVTRIIPALLLAAISYSIAIMLGQSQASKIPFKYKPNKK